MGLTVYKPGKGFHDSVIKYVKPEYAKLIDESELAKCLHGQTRSAIESFNSLYGNVLLKLDIVGEIEIMMPLVISIMADRAF